MKQTTKKLATNNNEIKNKLKKTTKNCDKKDEIKETGIKCDKNVGKTM